MGFWVLAIQRLPLRQGPFFVELHYGTVFTPVTSAQGPEGSLSNDDGDSNENGKKRNRFRLAKQQLCTYSTFFCTFLYLHRTTTTRKCLILRFVEDVNTTERLSFFLS